MLFKKLMRKTPYIGNLVPTHYAIVSTLTSSTKVIPAYSVRCAGDTKALIITSSELHEAHIRFIKYIDNLPKSVNKKAKTGIIYFHCPIPGRFSAARRQVILNIAYFISESGDKTGYMFTNSDLETIMERSHKIERTGRYPTLIQRLLIFLNYILGNIDHRR